MRWGTSPERPIGPVPVGRTSGPACSIGFEARTTDVPHQPTVQGKPAARRGRKARDLGSDPRPPGCRSHDAARYEVTIVKANLARFTLALVIIASMALTLGAGIRWNALLAWH